MLKLNASYVKLSKLGFMKRSISCVIRWKRNCTEMCPAIMRGIPPQKSVKTRRRATGQRVVRTTFPRVRNSCRICSISPGSVE